MKRKCNGYITVYLSLMLGMLLILVMTVIEGMRRQTVRFETECVMDAALTSIFAEYHKEMVNRYGLLFIDDSYGGKGDIDYTKAHFLRYMNINFQPDVSKIFFDDLTAIHGDNVEFNNVSFASDDEGTVLRYQIVQYMKTKSGFSALLSDDYDPLAVQNAISDFESYRTQREVLDEQIDSFVNDYNAGKGEDELYDVSNPADCVEKTPDGGVLYYAFGDKGMISLKEAELSNYISHRGYVNGCGLYEGQGSPYSPADTILFEQYLFEKTGYKGQEISNSLLDYQIEYLLEGKASDIENIKDVLKKIFSIRYAVNITYLHGDAAKQNEAYTLALTATSVIAQPELAQAVKESILLAWAYAESAKDLRILFDGYKLSPVKTEADWNTSLDEIPAFKEYLSSYHAPVSGSMEYKDFLKIFLALENKKKINMRLMDIMEMDIRLTNGNSQFRIDNLIYQLFASANVSSAYGYGYSIERGFSYR